MSTMTHRATGYTSRSAGSDHNGPGRPKSSEGEKKEIWSSMLDGVSSGKRLPEKSLLVLGGTPDTQRDFLESLSTDPKRRQTDRSSSRKPPIANQFALGYTYQDVLDADHEDILARLSLYLLTDPSPSFTPLLKPLLNTRTLPHMLIVILLDWGQPWQWLRQLREWIQVLRALLISLDDESKDVMEENIISMRDRGRGGGGGGGEGTTNSMADANVSIPLGPGEWDEPLGIPLCVVCQNADKIEQLEKEHGWKEEEFDFILQYMRTVLLKHGASLVYTMPSAPGALQTLIHSSLGIHSMLKRQQLEHNVIDRDRILVPPNWDSWGKIRVLSEGFDLEGVSKSWSIDIQGLLRVETNGANGEGANGHIEEDEGTAVAIFEDTIRDPDKDSALMRGTHSGKTNGIEVESMDNQEFLVGQLETLDRLRSEDERERNSKEHKKGVTNIMQNDDSSGVVEEHIGPVQFNMGGIQVDADDMLKRLKDRETNRATDQDAPPAPTPPADGKADNEALASFFAGLIKRSGNSAAGSPRT